MRNVKKTVAWILGLVMLLGFGAAAAESALPEIPVFAGTLNVRPVATADEAVEYAKEFWALDFVGTDMTGAAYEAQSWQDDGWLVTAVVGDGSLDVAFDKDGNVVYMENIVSGWTDIGGGMGGAEEGDAFADSDETDEDAAVAWRELLDRKVEYPFLAEVNPAVYEEYTGLYPIQEGNNEYLTHYYDSYSGAWTDGQVTFDLNYSEYYRDGAFRIKIGVQTEPVLRIVFFDVYCDAEEGGNG